MAEIRDFFNSFKMSDMVDAVNQVDSEYRYFNALSDFSQRGTSQTTIEFDVTSYVNSILPGVRRGSRHSTEGHERDAKTLRMGLAYFKHHDSINVGDIQGWRMPGSNMMETYANVFNEKLVDMRMSMDQTYEFLKMRSAQGVFVDPGAMYEVDMYTEFGLTRDSVDFELGTGTTEIALKCQELKRKTKSGITSGIGFSTIDVFVDEIFFDKLRSHPEIKNAYVTTGSNVQITEQMMQWGILDTLTYAGVRFMSYNPYFKLRQLDGTYTELYGIDNIAVSDGVTPIVTGVGFSMPTGVRDLFRGFAGPSNKLANANVPGQATYLFTKVRDDDEGVDFEVEAAPLFHTTMPAALLQVYSSN